MAHLPNGIVLSCKKKNILHFATAWRGLENIILCEISQSEKEKYHMISLICGIFEQTELTSKTKTDSWIESRMTGIGGGGA